MRTLVWFRGKDLRIADHAPLTDAVKNGDVLPVFVLDPYFFEPSRAQSLPSRMQFLLAALQSLAQNIEAKGSKLILARGKSAEVIPELAKRWKVDRVVAHRWVEPFARERDERVRSALAVPFTLYEGETLLAPGTLKTQAGTAFQVYSQFAKSFRARAQVGATLPAPTQLPPIPADIKYETLKLPTCAELGIQENPGIIVGGERAGRERLKTFIQGSAREYDTLRDRLDLDQTSKLSADLKFGTVSARTVWNEINKSLEPNQSTERFLSQLIWREFAHDLLWMQPRLLKEPFRRDFIGFPWGNNGWNEWVTGQTGYPIVDASARELLATGFVHNRARMISASFLTKHLLTDYKLGEAHYMKYLTDGDWAQNNMGWQWSAGCGCDAQPYFRVFNPMLQGERFDGAGEYVRRWVPELAKLPAKVIHQPWEADAETLRKAGVTLGKTYPKPIVDHAAARTRFLGIAKAALSKGAATGT